jgi:hypothetical protein
LLRQLQILDFVTWKKNSVIEKLKNQFNEFLMELGLRSSTARCVLPEWPDDPFCPRRQKLQNTFRST